MSFGVTRSNTLRGHKTSAYRTFKTNPRKRGHIHNAKYPRKITTREVLEREARVVTLAQHRMQQYEPFAPNHRCLENISLDDEQRKAVEHILSSRDFVTLFRGGAGTGKSYTLREVKAGLDKAGHRGSSRRAAASAGSRSGRGWLLFRANSQRISLAWLNAARRGRHRG